MKKVFAITILSILLGLGYSQNKFVSGSELLRAYQAAGKTVLKAEKLADQAGDDDLLQEEADNVFSQALNAFKKIIPELQHTGYDSLLLFSNLNVAYISFYLNDPLTAKTHYLAAINQKIHLSAIADSVLFLPLVYIGGIYYNENKFDSAMYYYKRAEKIKDSYTIPLYESQRLYNRLGAMYYETGNYKQARNYFEKAIAILKIGSNMDDGLLANYEINIASLLIKLEEYEEAKDVYKKVLSSGIYDNEVYHNLAIIHLKEEKYNEALACLKKVSYRDSKKNIELAYNTGMCWSGLNNADSAAYYLSKAIEDNKKWYGNNKNISYGLILKFKADQAVKQQSFETALSLYQQALIQFCNNFSELDSTKNPLEFSGIFSYINLFSTLVAKADVFEKLYAKEKKIYTLENALNAYYAAFRLADYVEKTYDSDEARLFLGKIKYTVHSRPINISIHLYELTKDKKYLEAAWNFDQRNKASLLSFNLQNINLKNKLSAGNKLLQQETSLKESITRTLLKAQNITDSIQIGKLNAEIRDKEIELGKVQLKLNQSPEWESIHKLKEVPSISQLQKELDGSAAIISYHFSETKMLIFCLTAASVNYEHIDFNWEMLSNINLLRNALQNTIPGNPYQGSTAAKYLFKQLLKPVIHHVADIPNLILIPDDELHFLPFESLVDENDQYLVENFSIQYLYSASLFQKNNNRINYSGTLAFAPFAFKSVTDSNGILFSRLVYSKEEVIQNKGDFFIDSAATKKIFFSNVNKYPVVHLATHAAVDNVNPDQSYIAFYPGTGDHLLYTPEIYNLDLDSTQLIILSACETGTGQLIKGEGLMSLSRAFAYAGCSNIIASLWKAEDKSTSFITQQLYLYLNKGYSKSHALQKAKIDLLRNKEISPVLKSPAYWSHLILIGDFETGTKSNYPTWQIMAIVLLIAAMILFLQRKSIAAAKRLKY